MDLSQLTLAEIEALAVRLESAARTIRDAQSLLSGGQPAPTFITTPVGVSVPAAIANGTAGIIGIPRPASLLTPAERAEKERLMKLNFGPDDIDAMERA